MRAKILVVDDEPDLRSALGIRLRAADFEPIAAENGTEGLKKALQEKPDLILLDVIMPGLTGYEVVEKLKQDKRTRAIPVILLTVKDMINEIEEGFQGIDRTETAQNIIFFPFETRQSRRRVFLGGAGGENDLLERADPLFDAAL